MIPPTPLLMLWGAWLIQAAVCLWKVGQFAAQLRAEPDPAEATDRPRTWLIVPFKGTADRIGPCVASLCGQDYPDYRLVCVVESEDDPAHDLLQAELTRHPHIESTLLVAGVAPADQGQKTHNQRTCLAWLEPQCGDEEVWAFADSDAVPDEGWLSRMVGPLVGQADGDAQPVGVTSGYRWLMPQPDDSGRVPLAAKLGSVINASVATLAGLNRCWWANLVWGGAMAIRVSTARQGNLSDWLKGALTDDYQFFRMCRAMGRRVHFVPRCLSPSPVSFDLAGLWNFGHRQYLLTRVYAPYAWCAGLLGAGLYVAGCLSAWACLLLGSMGWLASGGSAGSWLVPLGVILAVTALDRLRSSQRSRVIRIAFGPQTLAELQPTMRWDRWATPLWMGLHLAMVLRAGVGRWMRWRGIDYALEGPQRVRRLDQASMRTPEGRRPGDTPRIRRTEGAAAPNSHGAGTFSESGFG